MWHMPAWSTTVVASISSNSTTAVDTQLFCVHHAGGTTASFAGWDVPGARITPVGYRGSRFRRIEDIGVDAADRILATGAERVALFGHSMGAAVAYETALLLQGTGRLAHVFLSASYPPLCRPEVTKLTAAVGSQSSSPRALEVLHDDLELLAAYPGRPTAEQIRVPVTLFAALKDPVAPPEECRRWAEWCELEPAIHLIDTSEHLFHLGNRDMQRIVADSLAGGAPRQ